MKQGMVLLGVLVSLLTMPAQASRIVTIGFEAKGIGQTTLGSQSFEGRDNTPTLVAVDTSVFRSGAASMKCNSGAGNATCWESVVPVVAPGGDGITVFAREYIRFASMPTAATTRVMIIGPAQVSARVTSAGKVSLWNDNFGTQIGSDSTTVLTTGQWYRIELSMLDSTTVGGQGATLRLDGVQVATASSQTINTSTTNEVDFGLGDTPGANTVCNIDDVAINNSSGASQNTWPGAGSIVALLPASDNNRGSWTAGAGGTTSLFDAVNNAPPVGVAAASETNTSQIKASATTTACTLNFQTYAAAGVPSTATVTLAQIVVAEGRETTTGSDTGSIQIVSNPAEGAADTYNCLSTPVVGTLWVGWDGQWGSAVVGDISAGNRSVSPTAAIKKTTSSGTHIIDCCYMGIMVEYVPAATSHPPFLSLLGVGNP